MTSTKSISKLSRDAHDAGVGNLVRVTKAIGDPLRAQIVQTLAEDAFGVLELCDVFGMAQPAMSHHLKILSEAGLVSRRKEGTTVFYQRLAYPDHAIVHTIYDELDLAEVDPSIQIGLAGVYERRSQRSRDFFANNSDAFAQQSELICSPETYRDSVLELVQHAHPLRRQHALEVGPGTGTLLTDLAKIFKHVTAMDSEPDVVTRIAHEIDAKNVSVLSQDFLKSHTEKKYDLILATMVVHHFPSPARFFTKARQLLHKSGLVIIAELCAHDQEWVQSACGDLWLGFKEEEIQNWAHRAGLEVRDQQFLAQRNGFRVQVLSMAARD